MLVSELIYTWCALKTKSRDMPQQSSIKTNVPSVMSNKFERVTSQWLLCHESLG